MTPSSELQDLRLKCIDLAIRSDAEHVIALAQKYEFYILGKSYTLENSIGILGNSSASTNNLRVEDGKSANPIRSFEKDGVVKSTTVKDGGPGTETKITIEVEESGISYNDMKTLILDVVKKKGRNASLDMLAEFGIVSGEGKDRTGDIGKLTEEQYPAVVEAAKKILAS